MVLRQEATWELQGLVACGIYFRISALLTATHGLFCITLWFRFVGVQSKPPGAKIVFRVILANQSMDDPLVNLPKVSLLYFKPCISQPPIV